MHTFINKLFDWKEEILFSCKGISATYPWFLSNQEKGCSKNGKDSLDTKLILLLKAIKI